MEILGYLNCYIPIALASREAGVSVTVAINRFVDFEALQGIMQDGHSDVVQIGRGRMSGSLTHISAGPSFGISSGNFSRGARLRGVTSQRRFMLGMVLATDGEATAWQQEVESGDFLMVAPGQERYSVYQDATKFSSALVSPQELEAFSRHPARRKGPSGVAAVGSPAKY